MSAVKTQPAATSARTRAAPARTRAAPSRTRAAPSRTRAAQTGTADGERAWPSAGSAWSPTERAGYGKALRDTVPREGHAALDLPADRRDPIALLEAQAQTRLPDLVPVRYGRMTASPFAYFRGAAYPMASDLATTAVTGLTVQACGDAHLSNFGLFGSPERRLVFDINDFDETLPAPWEWDVKRLAASIEIAARESGFPSRQRRKIVLTAVTRYREAMREFAGSTNLEVWYARLDVDELQRQLKPTGRMRKAVDAGLAKARSSDSMQALAKLCRQDNGRPQIISDPPLVVPVRDLVARHEDAARLDGLLRELLASYRETLPADTAELLSRYELADIARKVVGVGSVGTRCWITLLLAADGSDPLFLQVKEAEQSVLAEFAEPSLHAHQGERVVVGQRFMQAASDIFLGWMRVTRGLDRERHDYYVRQLRDWKFSFNVAGMPPDWLRQYASACGWALARAHAKTGDRFAIAAYLGSSDIFDEAIADFAGSYADQNERDYDRLADAVKSGQLACEPGV